MKYSALLFDVYEKEESLKQTTQVLEADTNCCQIVVACRQEDLWKYAIKPTSKTMYVAILEEKYLSLLNALKAIVSENVLIFDLEKESSLEDIPMILEALEKAPAVHKGNCCGFDTRLILFTLQKALEEQLDLHAYLDAIQTYADSPVVEL